MYTVHFTTITCIRIPYLCKLVIKDSSIHHDPESQLTCTREPNLTTSSYFRNENKCKVRYPMLLHASWIRYKKKDIILLWWAQRVSVSSSSPKWIVVSLLLHYRAYVRYVRVRVLSMCESPLVGICLDVSIGCWRRESEVYTSSHLRSNRVVSVHLRPVLLRESLILVPKSIIIRAWSDVSNVQFWILIAIY